MLKLVAELLTEKGCIICWRGPLVMSSLSSNPEEIPPTDEVDGRAGGVSEVLVPPGGKDEESGGIIGEEKGEAVGVELLEVEA